MEIILLEDVKALGKKGQIVKVNDGYARNYILPKKLGVEANARNKNELRLKKAHEQKLLDEQLLEAQRFAGELKDKSVEIKLKCGEGGKTFGSVSTKEIAAAAGEQLGFELDKKKILLKEPVKSIGVFNVPIRLHQQVTAELTVKVTEL